MSGAEVGFIIGLIGSLISIVDVTKKIHDAAGDAKGQPEAFCQVAARLPLVIEILRSAEAAAPELDEPKREAIEPILKSCKAKAEKLQEIFQKVIRKDDDQWFDRYKKALRTLGKGDKVECLMEGIQKDTQLLASEKLMGIATEAQVKGLEEGIKEMKEMPSSLKEDTGNITQTHSGSGDIIGHSGSGNIYAGDSHHNQPGGDVQYHYGSKE
ncbi:hypothetical protein BGZ57DRAFT_768266 [Hyaloscypha finlandica]|nr:hypothetical protein BGZ57DRAFT_768266 [Hyaloscypha finlandica]